MSVPDPAPARKPSRLGLYVPFGLLLIAILAWSAAWVWARSQTAARLDAVKAGLQRAGYELSWRTREIGGYPFRLDVTLTDARLREPSGWELNAPDIQAEAYMHALGHWLIAAPQGATFVRPEAGSVTVTGRLIRASLTHLDQNPPSFSFEGVDLAFRPGAGAQPFALSTARRVEFHLRAGPDDQGGVFFHVDEGKARLSGLFARIAGDKPISIVWNATLSKMSAFRGRDWPSAVRRWGDSGGQMSIRQAGITAGEALIGANAGTLTVGADGRLRGTLPVTLKEAPRALAAMGETGVLPSETASAAASIAQARGADGPTARAALEFQAGRMTLGPVAIGPAPKIYEAP